MTNVIKNVALWIAIALGLFILWNEFKKVPTVPDTIVNNYFYDTTNHQGSKLVNSQPIYISTPVIPQMDSAAMRRIVEQYFSTYFQQDTISDDSLQVVISDSLNQNKVFHRKWNYKFKFPVLKESVITIHEPVKNKFYVGGMLTASSEAGFSPTLMMQNKKENIFTLGTDLLKGERNVQVGYFVKLRIKK